MAIGIASLIGASLDTAIVSRQLQTNQTKYSDSGKDVFTDMSEPESPYSHCNLVRLVFSDFDFYDSIG